MVEDREIVSLYWRREERAISETDKKYGRYCYTIAYRILNDEGDADETLNDTYLKAWNTIPPNRPEPLKPYVGMLSRQIAFDQYEKKNAVKRKCPASTVLEELAECIPDGDSGAELGESVALRDALNRFVRALPKKTREIFLKRYWYAVPISEIAKEYGVRENGVAVLLLRTRQKLKAFLEKEGFSV